MTDGRVETRVTVDEPAAPEAWPGVSRRRLAGRGPGTGARCAPAGSVEIGFQEYFVGLRHDVAVKGVRFAGAVVSRPGPRGPGGHRPGRPGRHLPLQPGRLDRPGTGRPRDRRGGGPAAGDDRGRLPHHRRQGPEGPGRPHAGRARLRNLGGRRGQAVGTFRRRPGRGRGRRRPGAAGGGGRHPLHRRPVGHVRPGYQARPSGRRGPLEHGRDLALPGRGVTRGPGRRRDRRPGPARRPPGGRRRAW